MKENKDKYIDRFNALVDSLVESANDDLEEAQSNVEAYFEMVDGDPDMRAVYGNLYHEAIRIKNSIRDRTLKIAVLLKDRIGKIETDALKAPETDEEGTIKIDHKDISEFLKQSIKDGTLKTAKLDTFSTEIDEDAEDSYIMNYSNKSEADDT